ncbi:MAG: hypothetical protein KatS3mg076_2389 [Candidatus Binatia bacterium]|nr:MAG: hypothetical protein KatS3mg076_2389 [Candidatus Binatia bacterium]
MRKGKLLLPLAVALFATVPASARELPDIVLVTLDTTRADRLGCYGYFRETSPALDRLAGESLFFENAVTPIATTLPAHVSLLTGTNPTRHGIPGNFAHFRVPFRAGEGIRSVAQMLSELGYRTAAFVGAAPVKAETGIAAGFQLFDEPERKTRRAEETTDRAVAWLEKVAAPGLLGRLGVVRRPPFFLWVHYIDPHSPYRPPKPFDSMFRLEEGLQTFFRTRAISPSFRPEEIVAIHNGYDGEIRYVDTELGRLFEKLRKTGLYDRAVVVVTSDHGEGLGQHDWTWHGEIYNEQLFVPLFVKFPQGNGLNGQRVRNVVSLIDVFPTLFETLGIPVPVADRVQFEGRNVLSRDGERSYALSVRVPPRRRRRWDSREKYALTGVDWKYIYRPGGSDELYDMGKDRIETRNVVDLYPEVARNLRQRLLEELERSRAYRAPLQRRDAGQVSEEIREQLRSLGYEP